MGSSLNILLIMAPEKFIFQGNDKHRQQRADIECRLYFKNNYGLNSSIPCKKPHYFPQLSLCQKRYTKEALCAQLQGLPGSN